MRPVRSHSDLPQHIISNRAGEWISSNCFKSFRQTLRILHRLLRPKQPDTFTIYGSNVGLCLP